MNIELVKLSSTAKIPERARSDDAGIDLFASEKVTVPAKKRKSVPTGIAVHLPKGTVGLLWDRGSVAKDIGLTTLGGVIDAGYQGEIRIIMYNTGKKPVTVKKHEKIAQLIIQPFIPARLKSVKKFSKKSARGKRGFGSTGT